MARVALALILLAAGCGFTTHDYSVQATILAGGGAPGGNSEFNSGELTAPLSGDATKISSVKMNSVVLSAIDGGDLTFVTSVTLSAAGNNLPSVVIATLPSAPAAGVTSVALQIDGSTDLKPYLFAGGNLTADLVYGSFPATARTMVLTLNLEGSLF
jgi:hypothetical protein